MSPRAAQVASPQPRVVLSWRKKLLFGLAATVLFFAVLELGLWLLGVRTIAASDDPFVGFAGNLPLFVEETGSDGQVWMTTAPNKLAWFNPQRFPLKKAPGTRRVFSLGGSTTYGHPYDDKVSFSAWLRELLPSATENTQWEVINAGGISYASYRVAALMEELARYEPDLFIVYTGHNEFLEERTYGDLRRKPAALLETASALSWSRTYSVLHRVLVQPERPKPGSVLPAEVDAVLDHTVGPVSYQRDDLWHEQVLAHFEVNLIRMAQIARSCGAELVLVVPAVNLKDCSPFKSEHSPGLSAEKVAAFQALQRQTMELQQQGQLAAALAACEEAAQIDPRHADNQFRMARLLLALGRAGEAAAAFERAVDEDVCPLRAPTAFRDAMRQIAAQHEIPLVDFDLIVKNDCLLRHGHNSPGEEYFLDHVHLTIDGYRMAAAAIIDCLNQRQLLGVGGLSEDAIDQATKNIYARIDRKEHAIAERNVAKVFNWAGKHEEAGRLALKALETLPDEPECLVIAGAYLRTRGQLGTAIEYLQRSIKQLPDYGNSRQLLGAMLVEAGRLDEAREQFLALTRLQPEDAAAWQMVGAILAEQQQYEAALEYYRRALALTADDANLHYNLGFALAKLQRRDEARRHLRQALALNPQDMAARELLAELEP